MQVGWDLEQAKRPVLAPMDCVWGGAWTACVGPEVGAGQRGVCRGCGKQGAALLVGGAR